MKKMKLLWLILFMYPAPKKCLENIVQETLKTEKPEREDHIREREWSRLVEIRKSAGKSLKLIVVAFVAGYLASLLLDIFFIISELWVRNLRILASLIIAWAVLSKLTKEIESWGGKSLPEQLQALLFRIMYCIGVSIIICTLFLKTETLPVP